jgi:hypothetical protein
MKTILFNLYTMQPELIIFYGGYKIDGEKVSSEEIAAQGFIELEVIETPMPKLETNQQAKFTYEKQGCNWVRVWQVYEVSDWLHPHQLRIVVPKTTLQQHRDLLIFKSYAEVMGLPFEVLEDVVHFYCNEILPEDQPRIEALNLIVETK